MGIVGPVREADFLNFFRVPQGSRVQLSDIKPGYSAGYKNKNEVFEQFESNKVEIANLQRMLYAGGEKALLIVLQGMDASGKDGTIRHVLKEVDPQACQIASFKTPSDEELSHDFLWRVHKHVPPKGFIGVFNRSHYEDVLVPKVKGTVPEEKIEQRYEQINDFERILSENDVTLLKFFLYISKNEQRKRFLNRVKNKEKNWKLNPQDLEERTLWKKYKKAYEEILNRCSTEWAPWYIIPANHKWFRNLVISQIIKETLQEMDLKYPKPDFDPAAIEID